MRLSYKEYIECMKQHSCPNCTRTGNDKCVVCYGEYLTDSRSACDE